MGAKREQPEFCDSCDYTTGALKWYSSGDGGWLCLICASTPAGNVALYPKVHQSTDSDVLKTVVLVGHMILDALKEQPAPH